MGIEGAVMLAKVVLVSAIAGVAAILSDAASAALIAGIFSVMNTAINAYLLKHLNDVKRYAESASEHTEIVKNIVDRRQTPRENENG